jgi:hypothetical protein
LAEVYLLLGRKAMIDFNIGLTAKKHFIRFCQILIPVFILAYSLIFVIGTDYAWYMHITDYYIKHHVFYNQINNTYGGWGIIFIPIHAFLVELFGNFYLNYWLLNLFCSLVGMYYLYKLLRLMNIKESVAYSSLLLYIGFAFATGIFIGTRPESIYISSIIVELYYVFLFYKTNQYKFMYLSTFASTIGALSHPNGIVGFIILFFVLVRIVYIRKFKILHITTNILLMLGIFYFGITFGDSTENLIKSILVVTSDAGHTIPFYYEPIRYISFLFNHGIIGLLFIVGFTLTLVKSIKDFSSAKNQNEYYTLTSVFIFIIIYLIVLGAKWDYYLALLFPFIVLSIAQYINKMNDNVNIYFIYFIFLVLFSTVIDNFKKNELFLDAFNIKSERVIVLQDLKYLLQNKIIVAPVQFYPLLHDSEHFIPLEQFPKSKLDYNPLNANYVILNVMDNKNIYEKRFDVKLNYIQSLVYGNNYCNLFRISRGDFK